MTGERALRLPVETLDAIDSRRGRMSRSDFVESLLLRSSPAGGRGEAGAWGKHYVTEGEFQRYREGVRSVLRAFLELCMTYGMGVSPGDGARLFTAGLGRPHSAARRRNGNGSVAANGHASRN